MMASVIRSNKFSMAEITIAATVRIRLHQEVIRRAQAHPAIAAALVHQEAAVEAAVVAQLVQAGVGIKS